MNTMEQAAVEKLLSGGYIYAGETIHNNSKGKWISLKDYVDQNQWSIENYLAEKEKRRTQMQALKQKRDKVIEAAMSAGESFARAHELADQLKEGDN